MLGFRYLADAFVRGLLRRRPPRIETFDEQYPARRQRVEQVCHVILRVGIPQMRSVLNIPTRRIFIMLKARFGRTSLTSGNGLRAFSLFDQVASRHEAEL